MFDQFNLENKRSNILSGSHIALPFTSKMVVRYPILDLVFISAVLVTRDALLISIFLAGNYIDLTHRITIVIFNMFFKF